jgi:transposase
MELAKAKKLNTKEYPTYLMFQDEARFGRLSDPRRCWAPMPFRPLVQSALIREYKYIYGAVCPTTGNLDYMMADNMKTDTMSIFLRNVSKAHPNRFVVMVVDGASSHKAANLAIPKNLFLIFLPPYSPELNPAEQIWNSLRRNYFSNRYFDSLDEAISQANYGLAQMKSDRLSLKNLTNWPWISKILNAT